MATVGIRKVACLSAAIFRRKIGSKQTKQLPLVKLKLAIFFIHCCVFVVFFLTIFGQSANSFFLRFASQSAATVAYCFGQSDVFFDFLFRKQAKSPMSFLFHV